VDHIEFPTARFNSLLAKHFNGVNEVFSSAYQQLKKEGLRNLYYLPSKGLIGDDGEGTVDGAHLTDLGFYRIAVAIEKKIREIEKQ
jgi:lysophospholipase L1-like esterase